MIFISLRPDAAKKTVWLKIVVYKACRFGPKPQSCRSRLPNRTISRCLFEFQHDAAACGSGHFECHLCPSSVSIMNFYIAKPFNLVIGHQQRSYTMTVIVHDLFCKEIVRKTPVSHLTGFRLFAKAGTSANAP
ncbi:hypothetical protein QFZ80_001537 [Paenibacillus sp. V4I7]|nr:hypothetical protein [Paenibacillus sp. V4I7]